MKTIYEGLSSFEELSLPALSSFIILAMMLLCSCSPKPFIPVNEGREYGNPKTPMFVMHALEKNQWSLNRVDNHGFFKRLICFHYACRRMIGRSKTLLVISKKEYIKVIKKNAERGFFDAPEPKAKVKPDSMVVLPDTATIVNQLAPEPKLSEPKADSLITLDDFLFETNSYKLKPQHYPDLDNLSNYLTARPLLEVTITGHTDTTGDERHNVTLSARRAESVAEYLVGKGVNYDHVIFKGVGSSQPVATNETAAGRSQNRRVEILIRKPRR